VRLVSFSTGGADRAGLLRGDRVVDLHAADPAIDGTLLGILRSWGRARSAIAALPTRAGGGVPLADVSLGLPFTPPRILGTGANYRDHLEEMKVQAPTVPSAFLKLPGSELGPDRPLLLGGEDRRVDYEGEIAIVIGRAARDVSVADAPGCIAGLMLANDVSRRDCPMAHATLAKGGAGFCPLGPQLVTLDELDLADVSFTVHVNGELRQEAHTARLIHPFADVVAAYARVLPLDAGDVILTGTPAGVGVGRTPPVFLRPGDEVVVESPQLGRLRTPVSSGPPA
jgi:2-keto-4-pentenoate hydratase/2-oxohepta-3-ene-1,7-dioic acid hydratase in catechol pathway